jgi:hypothetical protein
MRRIAIVAVLCSALMGLMLACGQKPSEVIQAFQEAYNNGTADEVMSLYAEDASFQIRELFNLQGQEALRGLTEYHQALHTKLQFGELEVRGDTVFCRIIENNDWIEMVELRELSYEGKVVVRRGLIAAIDAKFTPEGDRAFRRVVMLMRDWARAERPEQLAELMPGGEFVYNAENAEKYLSLMRDFWKNVPRQGIRPNWKRLGG